MKIGSLFSGIGGLELGLEWSGLGETVFQVERDEYCRAVLAKHWPQAERFDDVCTVGKHNLAPVDLICGGFPCQDVSSAGKGAGLAGERSGLWRQYARIVSELRPRWVIVENVASGAQRWLDTVVRELEDLEYASLPVPLSAFDVGAPHLRRRIFVVAADTQRHPVRQLEQRQSGGWSRGVCDEGQALALGAGAQGLDSHSDAHRQYAFAQHAEVAEPSQFANALRERREGPGTHTHTRRPGPSADPWGSPQPDFLRVADGVSRGLDGPRKRIASLGNSVVPQCAEVVGWIVRELAGI